jgi:two-component system, OmpR family, sensor histidine kinase KdpD
MREENSVAIGRSSWIRLPLSLAMIAGITGVCSGLFGVNATTAGFAYLLGILLIAAAWGLIEAVVGSVTAMVCFGFFFLPPIGRFAISDPENWVALFAFLATSLVASHLSDRARKQTLEAKRRQQETERLYELSRTILLTGTAGPIGFHVAQNLARIFDYSSVALFDPGTGQVFYGGHHSPPQIEAELRRAVTNGTCSPGLHSETTDPEVLVAVITSGGRSLGSLAMRGISPSESALQALLRLVAIALERVHTQETETRAEAARQSEEFKSTLLDAIAHEFKTPLTSIKAASTSMLTDIPNLPPQVFELTTIIDEEASRLNVLVTDAARMAQIDASKIQLERQSVSVREFVDRVLEDFGPRLDGRTVRVDLRDELPRVSADPDLASMALRQVIDNGLKYSLAATELDVAAEAQSDTVTIRVRDRGPGIPEGEQEHIFDRFYRRQSVKERVPGSGMGLYIAREIARAHGGDLSVESKLGSGSVFCLTLPTAEGSSRP